MCGTASLLTSLTPSSTTTSPRKDASGERKIDEENHVHRSEARQWRNAEKELKKAAYRLSILNKSLPLSPLRKMG